MFQVALKKELYRMPSIDSATDAIVEIIYPEVGKVRSRTVVSRSKARGTGKYPSWKMGRMMQWESPHERNAFCLLDVCPAVTAFREQPLTIRYLMDGEVHTHYPDLLVEFERSRELWEIKPLCEAVKPDVVARTRVLQSALPAWGFAYRMVTGEELARGPRLSVARQFLKHGREPVNDAARERVRQILLVVPYICWSSATSGDLGPHGRAVLCRLALEGDLICDMEQPLMPSTQFSWRSSHQEVLK